MDIKRFLNRKTGVLGGNNLISKVSNDVIKAIIRRIDLDGDSLLSFQEFTECFRSLSSIQQKPIKATKS
jgi:hypothetical protein